jgi:hypothetical protein
MTLPWPREIAVDAQLGSSRWHHAGSNYCLDFHGDPTLAELCVFSDGNHHMALEQCLERFRLAHRLRSIFYCTTPPSVYLGCIEAGGIELGNLRLGRRPDLVIGPENIIAALLDSGNLERSAVFARSRGNHLLVRRGNPAGIGGIRDLFRAGVRLFVSNPQSEQASHAVYRQTLEALARAEGIDDPGRLFDSPGKLVYGELIHHREAPQALADGNADAAIVYAHLALRYTRIFPELFEIVELPEGEDNIVSDYAIGLVRGEASLATGLFEYFSGGEAAGIYEDHGLRPIRA